jgi:hypothetical protein
VISDQRIAELMGWSANPAHVTGVLGGGPDDLPARVRAVAQAAAQQAIRDCLLSEFTALAHAISTTAAQELLRVEGTPTDGPDEWHFAPCQADEHLRGCLRYLELSGFLQRAETADGGWLVQMKQDG